MVTAKHVLYGQKFDENPWEKYIVFGGSLKRLFELQCDQIIHDENNDLAAFFLDELGFDRCLPSPEIPKNEFEYRLVSIHGYLARDFRRELTFGQLKPQPMLYVNKYVKKGEGYVGILYTKSKNRNTRTGEIVQTARPAGMSGGPMLDAVALGSGRIIIVGVFTNKEPERGYGFGESSVKLNRLLDQMC